MPSKMILVFMLFSAVSGLYAPVPHRYHFVKDEKNWTESQSFCRQTYTDLATISNMEEMKVLNDILKGRTEHAWIGLEDRVWEWQWSKKDGNVYLESDGYRNWARKEPNNYNGKEYCVDMKKNGEWNDHDCNKTCSFVCYEENNLHDKKYIWINESKSWRESQSYCQMKHTDLACVRNQSENQQIREKFQQSNSDHVWIGLFREGWKWSDQSNSSFRYWGSGQPDNCDSKENCTAVFVTGEQGLWNDDNCQNKKNFICHESKLILIHQKLTWREALRYCREHHEDLVSVHTEKMQHWVMDVAQDASTEHVWLGLCHTYTLGFWYWVNGAEFSYQNWALSIGTGEEDCVNGDRTGAMKTGGNQQWVIRPETETLNFICTRYED